jgi:frataxin-like iron-binding protein CyaY
MGRVRGRDTAIIIRQEEEVTGSCAHFEKVSYGDLTARQKELFIKLADDWQGADFLAYHVNRATTLKVQLKSRVTIGRKYCDKQIWMAFPHKGYWYLIEHDRLVERIGQHTDWLSSPSWKNMLGYSSTSINAGLLNSLAEDRLGPVYGSVLLTE